MLGHHAPKLIQRKLEEVCVEDGIRGFLPSRAMCTDNAAMVASAAYYGWLADGPSSLETGALPNLSLASS